MKQKKKNRQFIVHAKSCPEIGVVLALTPTPPKGNGWRLAAQWSQGNWVFFTWERVSAQPVPANEYPYE